MFENTTNFLDLLDDNERLLAENQELRLQLIGAQNQVLTLRARLAGRRVEVDTLHKEIARVAADSVGASVAAR
jgi:hypothetical protein